MGRYLRVPAHEFLVTDWSKAKAVSQRPEYALEDRDTIRRQLLGYMERHSIGTPTLQARIADAAGRTLDEVNNKTLQRFLAGRHRTNDAFVRLCHRFLLGTDSEDPIREFGDAALRFFLPEDAPRDVAAAAGTYRLTSREDDEPEERDYSALVLQPVEGRDYLHAEEAVVDVRARATGKGEDNPLRFEGVALVRSGGLSLVLRDVLTRRPKWHSFYKAAADRHRDGQYSGAVVTPVFMGSGLGANDLREVKVRKAAGDQS